MKLNIKSKWGIKFLPVVLVTVILSCQPNELGNGNGLATTEIDAGFTITEVAALNNTYLLTANESYITSSWDLDNGTGLVSGGPIQEVFLPDAEEYTITRKVTGLGGASDIVTQIIDVETPDPVVGNLIVGGRFKDADDHAEWTILNISGEGADWTFSEGGATIVANNYNQQGIYQAVEVVAGREYKIDMFISGDGNDEAWFEVFASPVEPTQWSDYGNNIVMGLNTWAECGTGTFSEFLSSVSCVENSYSGSISNTVTFDTSGTVYFVIKCGGNTVSGFTISNVEMRGTGE
ncbi:hypothetical protein [Winogradskyella bathintestinalis]|uniref:PKD domain-containing protein n=1 Tax=Winogradskyella bathintestinalis TaxID=3035208 RepID=A0ABT7ZRD0_9FLAO|nr:hypothetical protein [Winogradskyella bathintestinalis]MDN3491568.1 hypothetical protein [Winogradskyella bathintestinalis]